ncbi:hypothetical protein N7488_010222 [Penicillium malachiteum]|nr:hypothetical protein N7488_010222 [Penicillium malachiteum]
MTRRKPRPEPSSESNTDEEIPPLNFFNKFPDFDYDPEKPVSQEFKRLGAKMGWRQGSRKWKKNWNICMDEQYDRLIGTRVNNLDTWQQICCKLLIPGEFTSIRQCRKALSGTFVNLVDLLDCWESEKCPKLFRSHGALVEYTRAECMFVSRKTVKQDKALAGLLKRIF